MLAKRLNKIAPSKTLAVTSKVISLREQGITIISFGAGEPDFDTPKHIKDAAKNAIDKGFTKYTSVSGISELKKAIVRKLKLENNADYNPEEIIVSNGGKHSIMNALLALLNKGDEVIIPVPYWTSYPDMVKLAEGTPVFCETENLQVKADLIKKKITTKTTLILLNSPSNPSGAVIEEKELEKIKDILLKNENIYVLSDEVYEHFLYDGKKNKSIVSLGKNQEEKKKIREKTIIVNSVSKSYSMTGWRIGFTASNLHLANAMSKLQSQMTSNPCSISQYAGVAAFSGDQKCIEEMKNEFEKRRDKIVQLLNKCKGVVCNNPGGAFYVFPNISKTGLTSEEFCDRLLNEKRVAVVPGTAFGMEGYIRLSYACSMKNIEEGLRLIKEFCDKL